jgi:ABC-type sugar transport system substrate-binding protein
MPSTTAVRATVKALGDRHAQITVTARLAFISKALKTKSENRLVALYAGFDTEQSAQTFANWVARNWGKTNWDLEVRPSDRLESAWEVKVRRPTEAQLQALVAKARLHPPTK